MAIVGPGREVNSWQLWDHKMATRMIISNERKSSVGKRMTLGAEHWTVCQGLAVQICHPIEEKQMVRPPCRPPPTLLPFPRL